MMTDKLLGALIRDFREARSVSQRMLAQRLRLSQSMVSTWENGAAIPSEEQVRSVANILGLDEVEGGRLQETRQQIEVRSSLRPRTVEYILHDADDFLDHNPGTAIWMLGPEHLPVLEVGSVVETWIRNLARPVDYHLIWIFDWVQADVFKVALPHFAQIASDALIKCRAEGRDPKTMGRVHFHVTALEDANSASATIYRRFCDKVASEDSDTNLLLAVGPYLLESTDDFDAERKAVHSATSKLVHIWQPDTSLSLYLSPRVAAPPVANIRLMPLSEQIHTKAAGVHRPMYWFAPRGAAHLSETILEFADALEDLTKAVAAKKGEVP